MEAYNSTALFIKRTEKYQNADFIKTIFGDSHIGNVKDVQLISKRDGQGREYNGAIVIFNNLYDNSRVKQLFDKMIESNDGTTRFDFSFTNSHGRHQSLYWIIQVHKPKIIETLVTPVLPDMSIPAEQQIAELTAMVGDLRAQLYYLQATKEQMERKIMEYEMFSVRYHMCNVDVRGQLEMKELEYQRLEKMFNAQEKQIDEYLSILKDAGFTIMK